MYNGVYHKFVTLSEIITLSRILHPYKRHKRLNIARLLPICFIYYNIPFLIRSYNSILVMFLEGGKTRGRGKTRGQNKGTELSTQTRR